MKRRWVLIAVAAVAVLLAGYFLVWPLLSPTISWSRFVWLVDAALAKEDHPAIALRQRVLEPGEGDGGRLLRCGAGQSVTIVGTGRADGDMDALWIDNGDFRLQNVAIGSEEDGGPILAQPTGAVSLSIALDERCVVRGGHGSYGTAFTVNLRDIQDGARLFIDNAGVLRGNNGLAIRVNDDCGYEVELCNSGRIEATEFGVMLTDLLSGAGSRVKIVNTGVIESRELAAVHASVWADAGGAELTVENHGSIRSDAYRGIAIEGSSKSDVSLIVRNGANGVIESRGEWQCVSATADGEGRIVIDNEGQIIAGAGQAAQLADYRWTVAPSALPSGWDTDDAASLTAAIAYTQEKLDAADAAALPVGTQVTVEVSVLPPGGSRRESLYRVSFEARVLDGGGLSPLEVISIGDK